MKAKTIKSRKVRASEELGRLNVRVPKRLEVAVRVRCSRKGIGLAEAAEEAFKGWVKG